MDMESIQAAVSGALGAGGAAWISRLLFARMISSYDQLNAKQDQKLEELMKELSHARERLAVLDAFLVDARALRKDMEATAGTIRGEMQARDCYNQEDIASLRRDLYIAHERIRSLACGENDFSKIHVPEKINRR